MDWYYIATRVNRDGTEPIVASEVPLENPSITRTLSGSQEISGSIPVEMDRFRDSRSRPIFEPWATGLYAILDGQVMGGGIVTECNAENQSLSLRANGVLSYLTGFPVLNDDDTYHYKDGFDLAQIIWDTVQRTPNANLGVRLTRSGTAKKVGVLPFDRWSKVTEGGKHAPKIAWKEGSRFIYEPKPAKAGGEQPPQMYGVVKRALTPKNGNVRTIFVDVTNTKNKGLVTEDKTGVTAVPEGKMVLGYVHPDPPPGFTDAEGNDYAPWTMQWWADHDLGAKWAELSNLANFDYIERDTLDSDGIQHFVDMGAPKIGRRRHDLRFKVGENVKTPPVVENMGDQFADEAIVFGAGEGRTMLRGASYRDSGRLRRPKIVTDKTLRSSRSVSEKARRLSLAFTGGEDVKSVLLRNHPNAPLGEWSLGDDILVSQSDVGWGADLSLWCRIMSYSLSPGDGEDAALSVVRSDKVAE